MKTLTPFGLLCCLLISPRIAGGAEPATPQTTSLQRLSASVTLATLSNGLTIIVEENHSAPVATVRCFVKNTGSAFEGEHLGAGLSHVLEHVVAGGSTTRRSEQEIERIINSFGGATNAATSTDCTYYYIDCPAANVMAAIELMAEAMQHVKFEPAEFERELSVVKRELADGEVSRQRVLWNMLKQTVYTTHPTRHPVIGYLDVLQSTTNQAIIDFYHERYVPNNQIFVVAGDVDATAVIEQVSKHYAGAPRGAETYVSFEDEPQQLSPRFAVREMDGATYDLALAWPTVKLSHPDLYALDVAAYILGEGESSRLVRRLKYDRQLVLSVNAASDTPHYVAGMFVVLAACRPDTWQQAETELLQEVYALRDELVDPAELSKAKKQKAAELVFGRQTAEQAADGLGRGFLDTGDPLFDERYVEGIERVTAEQVRDVARRYLVPQRLNRIVIAPPGGAPSPAISTAASAAAEIRKETLPNGLRVLLKRNSRLPLVNIQAFVLGGSLADDEQTAGRADLLAAMLDKGTTTLSAAEIAEYFDSIGGQLAMSAGRFTIFGSAIVLKDDFATAAGLFAECFTKATFPAEEFAKAQQLALGAIARRADDPYQEIRELFCQNLPLGSPYRVIQGGTAESVKKLTVADLKRYHARYFVPNNMLVTVFGDIDPDEALALVKRHFGELQPAGDFQPPSFDHGNSIPQTIQRHKTINKQTALALFGYPTAGILQPEDYAAMTLLDAIISGYSYPGGWLHKELRGAGLVYMVHAFQSTGPVPGYFNILAQTQPGNLDEVATRIKRNVERAKKGEIDEDEWREAVEMVIAFEAQQNTTIAEQAQRAALDELYGLGYDYHKGFAARIRAITRDKVVAAARKYLNNYVLVTTSPQRP